MLNNRHKEKKNSSNSLQIWKKSVPLHRVFHSIRFKVNKGWSKALLLFLCPYVSCFIFLHYLCTLTLTNIIL